MLRARYTAVPFIKVFLAGSLLQEELERGFMTHNFPLKGNSLQDSFTSGGQGEQAMKKIHLGHFSMVPPYLPHLESKAETQTPSQSHKCPLQRHRNQRAGPRHWQTARLRAQRDFQFGFLPGSIAPTLGTTW